ncbi:hypothetical protein Rsub_03336 [Raphidocelis subcapitata]|uniref:gamma-glutamylcyclotransferase n=1 Tax=Raphidocelis subcapitata TaxID=307507 RepID=A0A2V0NXA9_9CHLO|nr:hypothetical protein Rsub_03336 [Raphidocelis subcapitata]|eukprot:GBF90203.1 hypothetical protein Rsub_03336 [Raphidocelis subcapitata]
MQQSRLATAARPAAPAAGGPAPPPPRRAGVDAAQRSAPPALELLPGETAYFAYGSNMSPSVLTGRRRVRPRVSLPAVAPAQRLSFGMIGLPFSEPAFATLLPPGHALAAGGAGAPEAHGVVHAVSGEEWSQICRTEGVGARGVGYQVIEVELELYASGGGGGGRGGGVVRALTLQGAEASLHSSGRRALPSRRYLDLLRSGAAHHGLDPEYRAWLDSLEAYEAARAPASYGLARAAGALASGAVMLASAAPALPLVAASQLLNSAGAAAAAANGGGAGPGSEGQQGGALAAASAQLGAAAMRATWAAHDSLLSGLFGSGCSNVGPRP